MKSKISWQKNLFDDQVTVDEKDKILENDRWIFFRMLTQEWLKGQNKYCVFLRLWRNFFVYIGKTIAKSEQNVRRGMRVSMNSIVDIFESESND